jgi:hypothetical protein
MSVSQLPRDVLRLILFFVKPLDMFRSVSGVSKLFLQISKEETYWEREYEETCSETLKLSLDRVGLTKRETFLYFILNNPLRVLRNNKISENVQEECKKLIEYIMKRSADAREDEEGCWLGRDVFSVKHVHYWILQDYNYNLHLTKGVVSSPQKHDILCRFGFRKWEKDYKSTKSLFFDVGMVVLLCLITLCIWILFIKLK